jgi:S-formylglutathione hydrolase FrmB
LTLLADEVLSGDGRLHELTFQSDALGTENSARVLLPAGYDADARYPMLLLLHGASGNETSWTDATDLEGHTAALDLIVVMPNAGETSFYSDWLQGPQWETHILDELVPWVDATYRTLGTREGRAVAGLSMGGFGSMSYASRHPDRFLAAASFSGGVAIADLGIAEAAALQALGLGDDRRWGPYLTHEANWRGHNPPDLASNLRWTSLDLRQGNGVPCQGDNVGSSFLEAGTYGMAIGFAAQLSLAGVPYSLELRPCGTHEWHYWDHDIASWLPLLMAQFAEPSPRPVAFDYRTTDAQVSVWGWSFATHDRATEFLDLRAVSPAGLSATGSGLLDVVTAPSYDPGATYSMTTTEAGMITVPVAIVPEVPLPAGPGTSTTAVADPDGRLRFTLDLGPAHGAAQYSPEGLIAEGLAVGSYFRTANVSIAQVAPAPVPAAPATTSATATPTSRTLPATGGAAPAWPLLAMAVAVAVALRRLATMPSRTGR